MNNWWNIGDFLSFFRKQENEKIVIPYKPGHEPQEKQELKVENIWKDLKPINLSKIKIVDFPKDLYFSEEFDKKQIVLHHTVSGPGIRGDIDTWMKDTRRIGTCIIIDHDGIPYQLFSSKFWAGHLGAGNSNLDRHSIGVELDNWGPLVLGDGTLKQFGKKSNGTPNMVKTIKDRFYAYYGNVVSKDVKIIEYTQLYGGYKYFEKYDNEQIRTLGELMLFWKNRYNIPLKYNSDMWDVSSRALSGAPGVWGHISYRPKTQKTDPHPQPELISMLKTLEEIV